MSSDLPHILTVPRGKRIALKACAVILFALGTLPSPWVSLSEHSVLPFLGGLFLAFLAYSLIGVSNVVLEIGPEGILLGNKRHRRLVTWSEITGFRQGSGIDRHKVVIALASDPAPRQINLGLLGLECRKVCHLPDTFGMKAVELADLLNRAKDQYIGDVRQSKDGHGKS